MKIVSTAVYTQDHYPAAIDDDDRCGFSEYLTGLVQLVEPTG